MPLLFYILCASACLAALVWALERHWSHISSASERQLTVRTIGIIFALIGMSYPLYSPEYGGFKAVDGQYASVAMGVPSSQIPVRVPITSPVVGRGYGSDWGMVAFYLGAFTLVLIISSLYLDTRRGGAMSMRGSGRRAKRRTSPHR